MSKDKTRALKSRLQIVARAASPSGLATGIKGFPPSDNRTIARLESEGLIARHRVTMGSWSLRGTMTGSAPLPKAKRRSRPSA